MYKLYWYYIMPIKSKKISLSLKKEAKKYGVLLTRKVGEKRVYISEKELKKQILKKKSGFGQNKRKSNIQKEREFLLNQILPYDLTDEIEQYFDINQIIDGKKDGLWISYYPNGQLKSETFYQNGKQEGLQREWHDNGQLMTEYFYQNGKREGADRTWYENGQLKSEYIFQNGKWKGFQRKWHNNGQLMSEYFYKNGKQEGADRTWYYYGLLWVEKFYKNGKLEGFQRKWFNNGELMSEEFYKNGDMVQ